MKEIIAWTVNVWRMYWGNGWIPYLLALGGACALIFGKKKKNSLSLVLYSVFLLVLFFCPFSGRVIMKCIGKIVYWRVLWLLPTVPLIAGGFTELVRRSRNRIVQVILVLVLTGVISEKDALKSIDLKVVFLFGGSLTLAKALDTTGAGELIADKIVGLLGADPSPILLLLVIFIVTCVLTNFMSNTATTALMIPIAVSLANNLGADPRAVVIATVIAGSCAYATPIGMPANTMVVGLGGYKFKDYVKSGLPLILVSFVICMILLPILFPFYP